MPERTRILIVASSGRALAASACRAGFVPLVADHFGDDDLRAMAQDVVRIEAGADGAIVTRQALAAVERLAAGRPVAGLVYGGGLEADPALIEELSQRWPVIGNAAETVRRLKDPVAFAALCQACGVAHPEITAAAPDDLGGWLARRRGGTGGRHIRPAEAARDDADGMYFQRLVSGRAVSALFLADGRRAHILGFSEQWTAPTPQWPYRYGGAVQPADLDRAPAHAMTEAVERFAANIPMVGLNSADFLVADDGRAWCLEINPRPGATLDIFDADGANLFRRHVEACRGTLPAQGHRPAAAAAAGLCFADRAIAAFPRLDWPHWASDRQPAGSRLAENDPICTITARAPTKGQALALLRARTATMTSQLHGRAA